MKYALVLIAAGLGLVGCASTGQGPKDVFAQILAAANVGCTVDGQFQPLAAAVLTSIPQTAGIVSVDQMLVHPVVQAACAAIKNGTPAVQIKPPTT